ncbi:hypothetical protein D3C78_1577360 [compost metagenome]
MQHDQPGREQDHPPVASAVVGHMAGGEKAVVVAGVAGIEHPREAFFVMAQVPMHQVHDEIEEQQGHRYRQPFEERYLVHGAPENADRHQAEHQYEGAMQPGVITGMNVATVTGAECFGGLPHCNHLSFLLSPAD